MQNCSVKTPYPKEAFIILVREEWSKNRLTGTAVCTSIRKCKWIFSSHGKTNITKRSLRRLGKMLFFYSHHCVLIFHLIHCNWGTCNMRFFTSSVISFQPWIFLSRAVLLVSSLLLFQRVITLKPNSRCQGQRQLWKVQKKLNRNQSNFSVQFFFFP